MLITLRFRFRPERDIDKMLKAFLGTSKCIFTNNNTIIIVSVCNQHKKSKLKVLERGKLFLLLSCHISSISLEGMALHHEIEAIWIF
jgi:hypothetical protein